MTDEDLTGRGGRAQWTIVILATVLAAGLWGLFLWQRSIPPGDGDSGSSPFAGSRTRTEGIEQAPTDPTSDPGGNGEESESTPVQVPRTAHSGRVEQPAPHLVGQVVFAGTESGAESPGLQNLTLALATWAPATTVHRASQTPWWSFDRARNSMIGPTVQVDGGRYGFSDPPRFELQGSYVFVTHPNHIAGAVLVDEGPSVDRLRLETAEPVVVQVIEDDGRGVPGAKLESLGSMRVGTDELLLTRSYVTDEEGRALVSPLPDESILLASTDGRRSGLWRGVHADLSGPVTLTLQSTFSARGSIVGTPERSSLAGCEVVVRRARDEQEWSRGKTYWRQALATTPVEDTGAWSLGEVPWAGAGDYVFRLQGPDTSPVEVVRRVAAPGGSVSVDLEWASGHEMLFRTIDAQEVPQEDIVVVAAWRGADERWVRSTTHSDEEGLVRFPNLPEVMLWVRTYGEGFASQIFGTYVIPVEMGQVFPLVLVRTGLVRGRCLHGGEPVTSFQVTYWGDDPSERAVESFESREDGGFEIEDAPEGTVHLFATTPDLPASTTAVVELGTPEALEVSLELPRPVFGRGRVVDAGTGEAVSKAELRVFSRYRESVLDPQSNPVRTNAAGGFEGLLMSPAENSIQVTAAGYAELFLAHDRGGPAGVALAPDRADPDGKDPDRNVNGSEELDLGIIALEPLGNLVVQLVSETPMDFSEFLVGLSRMTPIAPSPEGEIVLPGLSSKTNLVLVYPPWGGRIDADVALRPGERWRCEISVGSPRTVIVHLEPAEGVEVPDDLWIAVTHRDLGGLQTRAFVPIDEDGSGTIEFLQGASAVFSAVTSEGEILATLQRDLPDQDIVNVTLPLSGKRTHLLFLDPNDHPVGSARVTVRFLDDPVSADMRLFTDEHGRLTLTGMTTDEVTVRVKPDQDELCSTQRVHLHDTSDDNPVIVRVDVGASLRIRLVERGEPAVGVRVGLYVEGVEHYQLEKISDAGGSVEFSRVSEGSYILRAASPGYWPISHTAQASSDPSPIALEVRRTGSLRFQVTRGGLPLAGTRVELTSLEYGESVENWIESGLAATGDTGLVSDAQGWILVKGLPNGPFGWRVSIPDGTLLEGEAIVAPLELTIVIVDFP